MKRRVIRSSTILSSASAVDSRNISECVNQLIAANPEVVGSQQVYDFEIPDSVDISPVLDYMNTVYTDVAKAICDSRSEIAEVFQHHGYEVYPSDVSVSFVPLSEMYPARHMWLTHGKFKVKSESSYIIQPPIVYLTVSISRDAIVRNLNAPDHILNKMKTDKSIEYSGKVKSWTVIPSIDPREYSASRVHEQVDRFIQDGTENSHWFYFLFYSAQQIADKLTKIDEGKFTTNVGDTSISMKRFFSSNNIPQTTGNFEADYNSCLDAVLSTVVPQIYPQCKSEFQQVDEYESVLMLKFTNGTARYYLDTTEIEDAYASGGCKGIIAHILKLLRSNKALRWTAIKYPSSR